MVRQRLLNRFTSELAEGNAIYRPETPERYRYKNVYLQLVRKNF
jgi:chromosome condensin MukBEF complex kleisin-like MukF subunit